MLKKLSIIAAIALSMPMMAQAGDAAAGKAKAGMCAACHGANGIAIAPMAAYIESSLKAFRGKTRTGGMATMMYGMAAGLSDADISNLAAYYSSL